ncbi:MAG: transposase, partial [Ramlibacter sp.]|nr:transposase [Ramlibacter sp.]
MWRDNGTGIRSVCRRFVALCRDLKLFSQALVAVDGSKFKAVNARDKNFAAGKIDKRQQQIEESIHQCPVKAQCTPQLAWRITRWEHEAVLEATQRRLDRMQDAMTIRRCTVAHVLGTFKGWMGTTPFLMRRLPNVSTEMSSTVLALPPLSYSVSALAPTGRMTRNALYQRC